MLTGKQRHFLRGLGHRLKPVVHVGKGGLDDGLYAAVGQALLDHELIKLKLGGDGETDRHEAAEQIAAQTKSDVAQVLGHVVLLYRAHPEEPSIELPDGKGGKGSSGEKPAKAALTTKAKRIAKSAKELPKKLPRSQRPAGLRHARK